MIGPAVHCGQGKPGRAWGIFACNDGFEFSSELRERLAILSPRRVSTALCPIDFLSKSQGEANEREPT